MLKNKRWIIFIMRFYQETFEFVIDVFSLFLFRNRLLELLLFKIESSSGDFILCLLKGDKVKDY